MMWQTSPLALPVTITASWPAAVPRFWVAFMSVAVPQMRTGNISHDMAEPSRGLLALPSQRRRSRTDAWLSGAVLWGCRFAVDVPVQRVPKVCKCRTSRVNALLVIRLMASQRNPRTVCLLLVFQLAHLFLSFCS